jgi:hypothetical protein
VTLVGVPNLEGPKESMRFSRVPLWQPPLMVLLLLPANSLSYFYHTR